jgi:hypothetical protein
LQTLQAAMSRPLPVTRWQPLQAQLWRRRERTPVLHQPQWRQEAQALLLQAERQIQGAQAPGLQATTRLSAAETRLHVAQRLTLKSQQPALAQPVHQRRRGRQQWRGQRRRQRDWRAAERLRSEWRASLAGATAGGAAAAALAAAAAVRLGTGALAEALQGLKAPEGPLVLWERPETPE